MDILHVLLSYVGKQSLNVAVILPDWIVHFCFLLINDLRIIL